MEVDWTHSPQWTSIQPTLQDGKKTVDLLADCFGLGGLSPLLKPFHVP
jgi:hypothetical protein